MSDASPSNFTPAPLDSSKRTWLIATSAAGAAGTVALATPFVQSFAPSERAKAAGAAVEVDISALKAGEKMIVEWRGKPVWIFKRTPEQLATLADHDGELADPDSKRTAYPTPAYAQHHARAAAFAAGQLGGRLLLSLPWLDLRHVGARVQEQAGARQPGGAPLHVPVRHQAGGGRGPEGIRGGHG